MHWFYSFMAAAWVATTPRIMVDRVVGVIDSDIITLRELEAKAAPFIQELKAEKSAAEAAAQHDEVLRRVLDLEIGERIVAREIKANRDRLQVGDKDVDRAIEELMKLNHLTREQLQSYLYSQGLTWREYQDQLRAQLERSRLFQARVQGKVQVADADARRRCLERQRLGASSQEICAAHVLVRVAAGSDAATVARAQTHAAQLRTDLAAGADFAAYALKHSADTSAADGALGCFGPGEMLEAFEKAAFALPVGEISQPVRTPLGFHVIKVTDRRTAAAAGCDTAANLEPFRQELYQEEMRRQEQLWIQDLRRKAFVDVRL